MHPDLETRPDIARVTHSDPPPVIYGVMFDEKLMDWPGRNQLMRSLARHTTVVLLQASARGSAFRLPERPRIEPLEDGLVVVRSALDARNGRLGRRVPGLTAALDGRWLRTELARHGLHNPLLWLTVPDPNLARGFPDHRLVYDCIDPNYLPGEQAKHDDREILLARRSRLVFASADKLLERMRSVNPNTHLLNNAAPVRPPAPGARPAALGAANKPVVGYLGTIDWRFDVEHVLAAASVLTDYTFALVGRVNPDQEVRVAPLRQLPNVLLPGEAILDEGDAWVNVFDVGLIPFTPSPTNDAINPVKMFMYLAVGLPVVATDIAECRRAAYVETADSPAAFVSAITKAIAEDDEAARRRRREHAARNTWDSRAREAVGILRTNGLWSS